MSNLVKRDPELSGSLGAESIFDVEPGKSPARVLFVPDTHYVLVFNHVDRAYQVMDSCGYVHHSLTRRVRFLLLDNVAEDYKTAGRMIQKHAKDWAS